MAENKTKATAIDPAGYIAAIDDESRRKDCAALLALMSRASKQPAVMWGTAIVGFGVHKYPLASGKQGEICAVGFSSRKGDLSIYGVGGSASPQELAKLGKHRIGKGCLQVARLADIDPKILEQMVARCVKARHG